VCDGFVKSDACRDRRTTFRQDFQDLQDLKTGIGIRHRIYEMWVSSDERMAVAGISRGFLDRIYRIFRIYRACPGPDPGIRAKSTANL
jgi:hypothetical protein